MSNQYRAVQWNAHKKTYDLLILLGVLVLVVGFVATSVALAPSGQLPSPEILALRALGTGAATLLTINTKNRIVGYRQSGCQPHP